MGPSTPIALPIAPFDPLRPLPATPTSLHGPIYPPRPPQPAGPSRCLSVPPPPTHTLGLGSPDAWVLGGESYGGLGPGYLGSPLLGVGLRAPGLSPKLCEVGGLGGAGGDEELGRLGPFCSLKKGMRPSGVSVGVQPRLLGSPPGWQVPKGVLWHPDIWVLQLGVGVDG